MEKLEAGKEEGKKLVASQVWATRTG